MTRLPDNLHEAARTADPGVGLDLAHLHGRAGRRRQRRRAGVVGLASVLLAVGIAAVGAAGAWSTPDEAVTATEGGVVLDPGGDPSTPDPEGVPPAETTAPVPETSEALPPSSSEPEQMASTSAPVAPSTEATPPSTTAPGSRTVVLRGTYEGVETYSQGDPACPDITHALDMDLTTEDGSSWVGREDYCGTHVGLQWQGEGTFGLTAPDGSVLAGTFTSTAPMGTSGEPYSLEVREGTGSYAGATGGCDVTIEITPLGFGRQAQAGTITCTLSVP